MDFVPFTLFFMVCLTCFHGSQSMPPMPLPCTEPPGAWPGDCADQTYCTCKPQDYPSAAKIQELLKLSDIDLSKLKLPELNNRGADTICRHHINVDPIYMIKDVAGEIRYVVQDPSIFQYAIRMELCDKDQSLSSLLDNQVKCHQKTTSMKLLVLTAEMTGVELADVKNGLPTSCAPEFIGERDR